MADRPKLSHLTYDHDNGVLTLHREDDKFVAFPCLARTAYTLRDLLGLDMRERKQGTWHIPESLSRVCARCKVAFHPGDRVMTLNNGDVIHGLCPRDR